VVANERMVVLHPQQNPSPTHHAAIAVLACSPSSQIWTYRPCRSPPGSYSQALRLRMNGAVQRRCRPRSCALIPPLGTAGTSACRQYTLHQAGHLGTAGPRRQYIMQYNLHQAAQPPCTPLASTRQRQACSPVYSPSSRPHSHGGCVLECVDLRVVVFMQEPARSGPYPPTFQGLISLSLIPISSTSNLES
jgi:hypothetical protein